MSERDNAATNSAQFEYKFQWWTSADGEIYYDSYDTREEALAAAKRNELGYIVEAMQKPYDLRLPSGQVLDWMIDWADEEAGEDGASDVLNMTAGMTADMQDDLDNRVNQAIEQWAQAHNFAPSASKFAQIRNLEKVEEETKP